MIAVERVHDYSQQPTETTQDTDTKPAPNWPEHGAIQAEALNLRYHHGAPLVLKDISFTIKPKEKVLHCFFFSYDMFI